MRFVKHALVAVLALPGLATPALAQTTPNFDQSIVQGPMTAWCDPGQMLLSGGYELRGAAPPAPAATTEETATPEPQATVAASHPT